MYHTINETKVLMDISSFLSKLIDVSRTPSIPKPNLQVILCVFGMLILLVHAVLYAHFTPIAATCSSSQKNMNLFSRALTLLFFILFLYMYFVNHFKTPQLVFALIFVFVLMIIPFFIQYARCASSHKETSMYLSEYGPIQRRVQHYRKASENVVSLAKCQNYHTGTFYAANTTKCDMKGICDDSRIKNVCNTDDAATLADFYCASSNQSCLYSIVGGNYVSEEMLKSVILGGARFVDFDVHLDTSKKGYFPVVKSTWGHKKPLNSIPLESCFRVIAEEAFRRSKKSDPFFVHLHIKDYNIEMIDRIADSIVDTFPPDILLDPTYHYQRGKSIATEPFCKFYNKLILCVSGDSRYTRLDELVNLHTTHGDEERLQVLEYSVAKNPDEPRELAHRNKTNFTLVRPQSSTLNSNPQDAWTYGCQFFLVNYGNIGNLTRLHSTFFKNQSFVMKSLPLQKSREIVGETTGIIGYQKK